MCIEPTNLVQRKRVNRGRQRCMVSEFRRVEFRFVTADCYRRRMCMIRMQWLLAGVLVRGYVGIES